MRETGTDTGGVVKALKARIAVSVTLVALLGVLGTGASAAQAESPWWHLSTGARPTYLHAGAARNETRKITVEITAGSYALEDPVTLAEKGAVLGETYVELPFNATAPEVELGLQDIYGGVGNVEVSEVPGGAHEFLVTWKGALADEAVTLTAEGATISQQVEARGDGEIYLTAENLGDAPVTGGSIPVEFGAVLPPGLRAVGIAGTKAASEGDFVLREPLSCSLATLACTIHGKIVPYNELEIRVAVVLEPTASSGESTTARISGGEGFTCEASATGQYADSGCIGDPEGGNFERVSTGAVAAASIQRPIALSAAATPFGVNDYELIGEEEGGGPAVRAGAHPFQLTTAITLNQGADIAPLENSPKISTETTAEKPRVMPAALAKDLRFKWPAGLIGNPSAFPQCTEAQFHTSIEASFDECPAQSAVGVATVAVNEPSAVQGVAEIPAPLFNLKPEVGEPARFGFFVPLAGVFVVIDTAVRSGGDYGVTVSSNNITQQAGLISSNVTVWGVPGDPRHNHQRGWSCVREDAGNFHLGGFLAPCSASATHSEQHPPAFISLPTSCTGPLESSVLGDSWSAPGAFSTLATSSLPALTGCNRLPFTPSIKVTPDGTAGSTPTGLNVDVHVPQGETLNAGGLAEAAPRNITVALPEGVAVNPSSGDGLAACSEALAGFTGFAEFVSSARTATFTERLPSPLQQAVNFCPDASKVATVTIRTPILPHAIEGAAYLASQNANPFGGLIALYVIAEDPVSGVVIKLAGDVHVTETGQLVTTFENSPQAPFEDAEFHFFGGERAPLATPARCGPYTTTASMTPWSGNPAATPSSTFDITSGPNGSACPGASLPFSPSLTGGTTNINAASFTPLTTTISRGDGQQNLQSVQLHMPAGLEGILAGVKLCPEAQANEGTCGPESQIGETTVAAGVGADPVSVTGGRVYITEKYAGAPFGLSIVNPVKAGPFDLEHDTASPANQPACDCLVVRAKIEVNPLNATLTITTDASGAHAIPHLIDGIPVQIKRVNVLVNREHFTFNPTNCGASAITGAISSDEGATQPLAVPFQATNCATLKFAPKFSVSTSGKTSKAKGASLIAKLFYPSAAQGTQANITRVKVDLPKQLPSRLTTLQKACTNAQFVLNPANCPKDSKIGFAKVTTPLLPVPLEGPAIFVSHGGEAFPSLTMVLQGYGVTVDLVGTTFISHAGITSTTFKTVPDVPFNTFQLTLPQGKFSALAANGNLCKSKLAMPTEFLAQNGAKINESTKLAVTGCAKAKKTKKAKQKRKQAKKSSSRQAVNNRRAK